MAHSLSAQKRVRQNIKHRARNKWRLRVLREAIRGFLDKIVHGSQSEAAAAYAKAAKVIDRSAQKGVIHKNQAARRKSRMSRRLKSKS